MLPDRARAVHLTGIAAIADTIPHTIPDVRTVRERLLAWGDGNLRDLPWRASRDPWAILVSEVMLQQTQVDRVIDRWTVFLDRFPNTAVCAAAAPADVIEAWAGLGYNRRAVMLHRAAVAVEDDHDGRFPATRAELQALPGVGPYTARAVMAFAFELDAAPVDTNIGRILARLHGASLTPANAQSCADELSPAGDAWRWNQTLMDFGATVCRRRTPACDACPLAQGRLCRWQGIGLDPATGSAAVPRPQSTFEGSDRQGRGRLVDRLRAGPVPVADAAEVMGWPDDPERAARVLDTLMVDGLVSVADGALQLAGRSGERKK